MVAVIYPFATNEWFAKRRVVRRALRQEANEIESRAKARLAAHRHPGDDSRAIITHTRGDLDHFINLVDPAALSIEFGHFTKDGSSFVEGLFIVLGAAGLR